MFAPMIRHAPLSPAQLAALVALAAALLGTVTALVHPPVAVRAPIVEGRGVA